MGLVVGRDEYYIQCDDPHALGCHSKSQKCSDRLQAAIIAHINGWRRDQKTGKYRCSICHQFVPPLKLTKENWWDELYHNMNLPTDMVLMLRALISATLHSLIKPEATEYLIKLAQKHLSGGIQIGDMPYTIMVSDPFNIEGRRRIFVLVPSYPNSELKRLEEF